MSDGTEQTEVSEDKNLLDESKRRLRELKEARNAISGASDTVEEAGAEMEKMSQDAEGQEQKVEAIATTDDMSSKSNTGSVEMSEKKEVSATTIGRMMGLVTLPEFKMIEGKIDLLSTRVNSLFSKTEKVISMLNEAPTGTDLERIDVQVGELRTLIKDMLTGEGSGESQKKKDRVSSSKIIANEESE